jgi:hypothetical protein
MGTVMRSFSLSMAEASMARISIVSSSAASSLSVNGNESVSLCVCEIEHSCSSGLARRIEALFGAIERVEMRRTQEFMANAEIKSIRAKISSLLQYHPQRIIGAIYCWRSI